MFRTLVPALFLAVGALAAAGADAAEIYRWKDANGTWHYADQPNGPNAERIRANPRGPQAVTTLPSGQQQAAAQPPPGATLAGGPAPPVSREVADQVRSEAQQAQAEQCKQAKEAYTRAIQSRRMFRMNDKGEREYLSEIEADTARLNARAEMDNVCAGVE